jgi:DNA-binding SARP family transcriptional activator
LLGKLYLSRDDTANAVRLLERAVELDPSDRTAAYQLMLAYNRSGRREKGAAMQRRVRDLIQQEREKEIERNRVRLIKAPDRLGNIRVNR